MTGPRLSIIPARAATDRSLKPRDLQVLCVLGRHTDDLGWCRRSQVKMADEMGCARSTVFEAIERLIRAGYLERHVLESENGRDSAHSYRVILDPVHPSVAAVADADDPCRYVGTPAGISAPPAGPEPAPPAGPGPAPINDPSQTIPPNEEERARARAEEGKQVERWLKRVHPRWPTYVTDSAPKALAAAMTLSAAERDEAVARLDDYLAHAKVGGRTVVCTFGVYLSERRWEKLPPVVEADKPTSESAAPFGPLWQAARLKVLLAGPTGAIPALTAFQRAMVAEGKLSERDLLADRQSRFGYPTINAMHDAANHRRGVMVSCELRYLAGRMEPVPVGSDVYVAWESEHRKRGWPWIPDPGGQRVVFFPAGGPDQMDAFEMAVVDGQAQEAAE